MRRLLCLALLIPLFAGCAYYNTFYNAKKFYHEAEKERRKRLRTQVVELSPEEQVQQQQRGITQATSNRPSATEMQNYQRAVEKASAVLQYYADSKYVDDALMLLGECFYYRREYKKAERKFEELQQNYPESEYIPEARLLMARTQMGLNNYDLAEERFRTLVQEEKLKAKIRDEAAYELAGLYFERENYQQAAENYQTTARSSGDKLIRAMSLYRLGECRIRLEQYDQAPEVFKRAVSTSPNEDFKAQAKFKLGESQSLVGDYQAAINTFSDLLAKDFDAKREPRIKLQLANNLHKNSELEEAVKWYNNILEEHKRTDAAARSNYALGQIEEFINRDYVKAKEYYDLARSEFANSLIVPEAMKRADDIGQLLDLKKDIARLEGREVEADSVSSDADGSSDSSEPVKDDAPINLSPDGMWVNYADRDRPPPKSLSDMSEADMARALNQMETVAASSDSADSVAVTAESAELDSAALARAKEQAELTKKIELGEKRLALAQLLLFTFDKMDSAITLYQQVIEENVDSTLSARALYSLGYIHRSITKDTLLSNSIFRDLIDMHPESEHAEGARRFLGLKQVTSKVDSAEIEFKSAERSYWEHNDLSEALLRYQNVIEKYPKSSYAPKALYARGYFFENELYQPEKAVSIYQQILEQYPGSDYEKLAQSKLTAMDNAIKAEEMRQKALADSIEKAQSAAADSLARVAAGSVAADSIARAAGDSTAAVAAGSTTADSAVAALSPESSAIEEPGEVAAATAPQDTASPPPEPSAAPVRNAETSRPPQEVPGADQSVPVSPESQPDSSTAKSDSTQGGR